MDNEIFWGKFDLWKLQETNKRTAVPWSDCSRTSSKLSTVTLIEEFKRIAKYKNVFYYLSEHSVKALFGSPVYENSDATNKLARLLWNDSREVEFFDGAFEGKNQGSGYGEGCVRTGDELLNLELFEILGCEEFDGRNYLPVIQLHQLLQVGRLWFRSWSK